MKHPPHVIAEVRAAAARGIPQWQISKEFGIHPVHLSRVIQRKARKNVDDNGVEHYRKTTSITRAEIFAARQCGEKLESLAKRYGISVPAVRWILQKEAAANGNATEATEEQQEAS